MHRTRISDEWVMGATVGAYVVLTFVLHFWGSAFIHYLCGNSPYPPTTRDGRFPSFLVFLIPGVIVGVLNWVQIKLAQSRPGLLNYRAVRFALWMNLLGILGYLVAVASNYRSANDIGFLAIVALLLMAVWPLGLVVSLWNLVRGCVGLAKSSQS